jgi:hypothetical protein
VYGRQDIHTNIWVGKPEIEKKFLYIVDGKITFSWPLKKYHVSVWTGFHWLTLGEKEQPLRSSLSSSSSTKTITTTTKRSLSYYRPKASSPFTAI